MLFVSSPKKTTEEEDLQIVACVSDNPIVTVGEIAAAPTLMRLMDTELIRQWLREAGIQNRMAAQNPLLFKNARAKRLAFAQEHLQWPVDD